MPTISDAPRSAVRTWAPPDLVGRWDFRRRLVDRSAGILGRATGTLTVTAAGAGCRWREDGELAWNGRRAPISRTLGLAFIDGEWWATFADGGLFHPWRWDVVVEHPCGHDLYRGLLRLGGDGNRLRIGWDVTGPAKQQRILTAYRRAS